MSVLDIVPARARATPAAKAGYRADIDGLRAVAVLAVVFSHAGLPGCGGGFVGVDVFFVISGYLITRNLESAPPAGLRGLLAFYGRRMRRILPALYLVTFASLIAAWVLLLPGEFDAFARSLAATLLFVPNILFLNQAGYFDHAAIGKPLLHTWSLGVEEQFYLIVPLLILVRQWLRPAWRTPATLALAAAGLGGCAILQASAPAAAFYLLPARLWEFLAGAVVAGRAVPEVRASWLAETLAGAALAGLGATIGMFSATIAHPGLPTLLPVLATATLIHVGRRRATLASALLGAPPMAAIGLISYSVYLWHWPLLVFGRLLHLELSPAGQLGGLVLLLGLATLTWRMIEQPFRDPASILRCCAGRLLPAAAGGLAAAVVVVIVGRGLPTRFSPEVAAVASYYDYADRRDFREGSCFITSRYGDARIFDRVTCLHLAPDRRNILLIGDSHAAHLWAGFKQVFAADNVLQATASGCKPLLHTVGKAYCTDLMREMFDDFLPRHKVEVVYLSAAWTLEDAGDLASTLVYLRRFASRVVVVGRVPGHTSPLPTLLARSLLEHDNAPVLAAQMADPFAADRLFKTIVPAGEYVSLTDMLCPTGVCRVWAAPGVPLQFDSDHLTSEGSASISRAIFLTRTDPI